MEHVNNTDLFCMILKNQKIIMRALATKCQQYEDELLGADSEVDNIIYDVHNSEYMADAHQIDNTRDMHEQLADFAKLLFKDADL